MGQPSNKSYPQFKFSDFKTPVQFVNKVRNIAEEERPSSRRLPRLGQGSGEHVDTQKSMASESDFILAVKID